MPSFRIDTNRVLHLTIIFLLVFSVVQVVWWLIDHRAYTNSVTQEIKTLYTYDMLAAQKIPVLAYHYPWPGVGHVAKNGDGFHYIPAPRQL